MRPSVLRQMGAASLRLLRRNLRRTALAAALAGLGCAVLWIDWGLVARPLLYAYNERVMLARLTPDEPFRFRDCVVAVDLDFTSPVYAVAHRDKAFEAMGVVIRQVNALELPIGHFHFGDELPGRGYFAFTKWCDQKDAMMDRLMAAVAPTRPVWLSITPYEGPIALGPDTIERPDGFDIRESFWRP